MIDVRVIRRTSNDNDTETVISRFKAAQVPASGEFFITEDEEYITWQVMNVFWSVQEDGTQLARVIVEKYA